MTAGQPARITRRELEGRLTSSALPAKTLVGFGLAMFAIVAIGYLSFRSLQWRAEQGRLVTRTSQVSARVEATLATFTDAETSQRGYMLTGVEQYLGPYEVAAGAFEAQLAQLRLILRDDPAQLQRLEVVARLGKEKMAELQSTIDLRRAGRAAEALDIVRAGHGKRVMDGLRSALSEMKDAETTALQLRSRDWETASAVSTGVVVVGLALLLALVVSAAGMSSRDFRAQKVQTWLGTAQTDLARSMQGVEITELLGAKIAESIALSLDASVGAVYFVGHGDALQRVGGFALPADASAADGQARPAAGITRQAYADGKLVETRDVPDDFFQVTSGLGRARARHLLVAPLTADGIPIGAIELGLVHTPAPYDLELLRRIGEPAGLALRSTRDRRDLREALEETQRQAEELQTQQEELRVQNEELEQQSQSLQESQARLQNQQAELEQINANLEEHAQTLGRQRDDLARAQAELQRASAYKSEFLANMSHELRTPLNSSLILAKLLSENRDGNLNAEQIKFAETIYSSGNDLLTLINDILDLSKIEAGMMDVRPETVVVARLGDELGDVFRPLARDKGIELQVAVEADVPASIVTDPTRVAQVLKNLLSNAVKFTERGGVSLRVRTAAGDRVAFEVKDTGIGIAPDQHELVFEAFRQADGTTNRKYGGTGLGLSISRDLARLLGGELTLDSDVGRGSTFTLVVPRVLVAPANHGAAPPAPPPRQASAAREPARPPAVTPAPATISAPRPAEGGERLILIVEDDPSFADVLRKLARELDFETIVATSGDEGLALAEARRPSAIVLDVSLPDRSGLSVLDALKHRPTTRHIPVHVMSVSDYTQAALEMGAAGYAIKPVKREELVRALQRLETKFTQTLHRILVVEDDAVARDSTCRLLAGRDVETVAVGTAAEALTQLGASTFDCMVLDLSLPDRSGFDLLDEMSGLERYAFPPVIVYTGRSLSRAEEQRLRKLSRSIIIKGARSPERLLDEVTLFLHQVESELPAERQRMLRDARHRETVFEDKRVLVVEDDVRNIFALSRVFEPRGAKVEIARNGKEALAHLEGGRAVDLVLMDVMMPEMDGLEATRRIRAMPDHAGVPIIALTAKAMADDREQCLAAGANDYIAKPLDVDKLLSLARVWVRK